ncbi:hypothetical protein JCM10296v2_002540 [Rhodotorula toruloides]
MGSLDVGGAEGGGVRPGVERAPTRAFLGKHLLEPKVPVANAPGWRSSAINIARYSWLNVLLVFIPVSWACHFTNQSPTVTFIMSFIAIIPLASLLGFATEDLAIRVGETIGGALLNATFGNAVELIIAILALVKGELEIVQASMIGSMLSNCLLVLGMCYFSGRLKRHEMSYGVRSAQININLLGLAVTAIVIPVAVHHFLDAAQTESLDLTNSKVLHISHGLWTHAYLYAPAPRPDPANLANQPPLAGMAPGNMEPQSPQEGNVFRIPSLPSWGDSDDSSSTTSSSSSSTNSELEHHTPKMLGRVAVLLLVTVTVFAGVTAEWLVSSIEGLVETGNVSEQSVALILLPLVGNASEHFAAVTVATKNKLDLSMSVAIGSSIQIALFVIPVLVLLGWCIGQPLSFYFDEFQTLVLFVSIVGGNWAIADGKTNWLEGLVLMVIYIIIALVFCNYDPGTPLL